MATTTARPSWYTKEDDSAWEKVKEAFRRDWEQTKHDFGGNAPDLDQDVGDTISQATGSEPIPPGNAKNPKPAKRAEEQGVYSVADEPAYRYGYAASRHYPDSAWDAETEEMLRSDFHTEQDFARQREAIRRGWDYGRLNTPK